MMSSASRALALARQQSDVCVRSVGLLSSAPRSSGASGNPARSLQFRTYTNSNGQSGGPQSPRNPASPGSGARPGAPGPQQPPQRPMGIIGGDEIRRKQAADAAKAAAAASAATPRPPSMAMGSGAGPAGAGQPVGAAGAAGQPPAQAAAADVIFEVDVDNFQELVLKSPVAVILDCYADWCEPCKKLTPRLEAVTKAARGALRLAKLNVDANPGLAGQLQVRSLPTVIGIVAGKSVDAFQGMPPDDRLRSFMEKVISTAEEAGLVPDSAAAPTNPVEAAEDAVAQAHKQLDLPGGGQFEQVLQVISQALQVLQRAEQSYVANAAAAAAEAAPPAAASASSPESVPGSTFKRKTVAPPSPVPQPLQDTNARALAALIRGLVFAGQKSGSGAATAADATQMFQQAQAYAKLVRERYPRSLKLPEVERALAASEIAAGAASALPQLQPLLDAIKANPSDWSAKLKLAEAQMGLGKTEDALEGAFEVLKSAPAAVVAAPASSSSAGGAASSTPTNAADAAAAAAASVGPKEQAKAFILKAFESLGASHPLTVAGRKKLSKLLFK